MAAALENPEVAEAEADEAWERNRPLSLQGLRAPVDHREKPWGHRQSRGVAVARPAVQVGKGGGRIRVDHGAGPRVEDRAKGVDGA